MGEEVVTIRSVARRFTSIVDDFCLLTGSSAPCVLSLRRSVRFVHANLRSSACIPIVSSGVLLFTTYSMQIIDLIRSTIDWISIDCRVDQFNHFFFFFFVYDQDSFGEESWNLKAVGCFWLVGLLNSSIDLIFLMTFFFFIYPSKESQRISKQKLGN